MMSLFSDFADRVFGRGDYSVSVPPMDGALRPNEALDAAALVQSAGAPGNLALFNGAVFYTDGNKLCSLRGKAKTVVWEANAEILAASAVKDGLALITADGTFWTGKPDALTAASLTGNAPLAHATALACDENGNVIVAIGSDRNGPLDWARDLMERGSSGSVWRIGADGNMRRLAAGLGWPAGLLCRDGQIFVSEAWRHRVVRLTESGKAEAVLAHLPGYPGALASAENNGILLCVFAPRSQLIELVLRQPTYRKRMMEEVPPHLWVAPAYGSGKSFLEPLQGGAVRQMGILKPWAPTRSYGLVVRLDGNFLPRKSLHSRANGNRHGIVSALEHGGKLYLASRGSGEVISILSEDA